jgi:Flp pilus assembly protein TadB
MGEQAQSPLRTMSRTLRRDLSGERLDDKLSDAMSSQPLARHALELRVVGRAVLVAAVATLVFALLLSPQIGAAVLILSFLGSWALFATRDYERRRRTSSADDD